MTVRCRSGLGARGSFCSAYSPAYKGFRVDAARVSRGTLVRIDDVSGSGFRNGGSEFLVVIATIDSSY